MANKTLKKQTKKSYSNSGIWINILGGETKSNYATTWVSSAVACRAENVAGGRLTLYKTMNNGEGKEVKKHPFIDLTKKVNIYEQSFYEIIYLIATSLDVFGKAYVYVPKSKALKPAEFIFLNPANVNIVLERDKTQIAYYEYRNNGKAVKYEKDEIIFFRLPTLNNVFDGEPSIKSCEKVIDVDNYQQTYQIKSFQNDGRVNVVLESDQLLSDEGLARLKDMLEKHTGVENSSSSMILEEGLKYKDTKVSNRELDYVKSREEVRTEIFSKLRVPAILCGMDTANYATAKMQLNGFIQNVIKPFSKFITNKFNVFIQNTWGKEYYITLEWDTSDPKDDIELYRMLIETGAIEPKEVRSIYGF